MENHVMSLPEESIYLKAKQSKDDEWVIAKKRTEIAMLIRILNKVTV